MYLYTNQGDIREVIDLKGALLVNTKYMLSWLLTFMAARIIPSRGVFPFVPFILDIR